MVTFAVWGRVELSRSGGWSGARGINPPLKPSFGALALDHRDELGELLQQFACLGFVLGAFALAFVARRRHFLAVVLPLPAQVIAQLAHLLLEGRARIAVAG
jgi:hypothetical protein